jgi:predicted DNA repair protein MutK
MATSLLALLDDITTVLDDVALLTKLSAKKTAGVLGDDLALNAQQVTGVQSNREIPVVLAVAKGSLINKSILVPLALAISAFAPWAITPLLMLGGAYLCFEGAEKLAHKFFHSPSQGNAGPPQVSLTPAGGGSASRPWGRSEEEAHHEELTQALTHTEVDLLALERDKVKGAVRTDFVLSAEIIAITLGAVAGASFTTQVAVLVGISVLMTVGVYGLVAGIVKLDDAGLYLNRQASAAAQALGCGLLAAAPWLMKGLSVVGTVAMFLVGGGIISHGWPWLHHASEAVVHQSGAALGWLSPLLFDAAVGIATGIGVLGVWTLGQKLRGRGGTLSRAGAHTDKVFRQPAVRRSGP